MTPFAAAVHAVVSRIRAGEVLTYGEVAAEAGYPGAARAVGAVLRSASELPWHRVVAAGDRIVCGNAAEQARRLEADGLVVRDGRVVTPGTPAAPPR